MKTAILIGGSSGIGRALVWELVSADYKVIVIARRIELLRELQRERPDRITVAQGDVSQPDAIRTLLNDLGDGVPVDLIVNCAGVGFLNPDLEWLPELETIRIDVEGFAAVAGWAVKVFVEQGSGCFVNISSIAALRGSPVAPAYNASKAFESNYMEGLRVKVDQLGLPISIVDIQPGFVDTAMAKGDRFFWMASPERAASQICRAIVRNRRHAYVTRRWRLVAWLFKFVPYWVYRRIV